MLEVMTGLGIDVWAGVVLELFLVNVVATTINETLVARADELIV